MRTKTGQTDGVAPLSLFYACLYASVGITLPYLPQHLRSLGLSGSEVGALMALFPLMQVFAPPLAGLWADRTRRGALLLSALTLGYALSFTPLLGATDRASIAPWLAAAAFCVAPLSMLADSLTLERLGPRSADYPRVRLWGSLGFVAMTLAFGACWNGGRSPGPSPVIAAALAAAGLAFLASLLARGAGGAGGVRLSEAPALLREPRLRLLTAATALHWLACSPHNLLFAVYLKDLGHSPFVAALGLAFGVAAEVAVMALFPRFGRLFTPRQLLGASFAVSAARWGLCGACTGAAPLVLLNLLHGLTFGSFMVSSVAYVNDVAPPRLRSTALALFVSLTYGVGGCVGYLAVGRLFDAFPARLLFFAAAALEAVPLSLVSLLPTPPKAVGRMLGSPEVTP